MINHNGLDRDDAEEIESRKERLRAFKEEHARRNGVAHPDKAPKLDLEILDQVLLSTRPAQHRGTFAGRAPRIGPTEQKLLDAAAHIWKPGEIAWPMRLANVTGSTPTRVSVAIARLRKKGAWPYASCGSGRREQDAERPALPPRTTTRPTPARGHPKPSEPAVEPSDPEPNLRAPDPEPIRNSDPRADAELLVIQRILAQLARLPTASSHRRVLAYLTDRVTEEED